MNCRTDTPTPTRDAGEDGYPVHQDAYAKAHAAGRREMGEEVRVEIDRLLVLNSMDRDADDPENAADYEGFDGAMMAILAKLPKAPK